MLKYKKEIIIGILLLISVVIICNTAILYNKDIPKKIIKEKIEDKFEERLEGLDILSFGQVFNMMYLTQGKGHIFKWRGNKYKTILKEDI